MATLAVTGQLLVAVSGQILVAAHTGGSSASDDDDDVSPGMLRDRAARLERLRQAKAVLDPHEHAARAVFDAKGGS